MRKKTIVSAALLVALAASAGIVTTAWKGETPFASLADGVSAPVLRDVAAPTPVEISRAGWAVGTEYVHDLDYRFRFAPPEGDATEQAPNAGVHVTGKLTSVVVANHGARVDVRVELADLRVDAGADPSAPAAAPDDLKAAGRPFYVSYDAQGRATHVHFPKETPPQARMVLRQFISAFQFTTPSAPSVRWSSIEGDAGGEYQAEYKATGPGTYVRTKTKYLKLVTAAGLEPAGATAPVVKSGRADFKLDARGRVERLKQKIREATPVNDVGLTMEVESTISLALARTGQRADAAALAAALTGSAFDTAPLAADSGLIKLATQNADRSLVDGASLADIRAELTTALRSNDAEAIARSRTRLSALFRLEPQRAREVRQKLDTESGPAVLDAIGFSGTPEAQKVLAEIMTDARAESTTRLAAVDGMFAVEHPTSEAVQALQTVAGSGDEALEDNASYMLGVAANKLKDDQPDASKAIVDRMSSDFGATTDPKDQQRLLSGLGNAGSNDGLATIEQGLASPDPKIRDASARALRFVADRKADVLLSTVLTTDPHPLVRTGALFAAGFRSFSPLAEALEAVCKRDTSADVRMNAISTLVELAKTSGDALVLLDWVASNDPDEAVREQAKKVIEAPPT